MIGLMLLACAPCPDGFARDGGMCVPDGDVEAAPLSEDNFAERYESAGCRSLEDCLCDDIETDYLDCDVTCEDSDWSWADGCAFDLALAEQCLSEVWTCDEDGFFVEAPEVCSLVYDCAI